MITILNQLTGLFDAEAKKMLDRINTGADYTSDVFNDPVEFSVNIERPKSLIGYRGVYIFIMTEDVSMTTEQCWGWNNVAGAPFEYCKNRDLLKGQCLYVGSCSSKSIYSRMGEHFKSDGSTTSLNINHPNRELLKNSVKIIAFPLKRKYDLYSRLIVTSIEKILSDALGQIVGKKRV
jgi:hypothetical protein